MSSIVKVFGSDDFLYLLTPSYTFVEHLARTPNVRAGSAMPARGGTVRTARTCASAAAVYNVFLFFFLFRVVISWPFSLTPGMVKKEVYEDNDEGDFGPLGADTDEDEENVPVSKLGKRLRESEESMDEDFFERKGTEMECLFQEEEDPDNDFFKTDSGSDERIVERNLRRLRLEQCEKRVAPWILAYLEQKRPDTPEWKPPNGRGVGRAGRNLRGSCHAFDDEWVGRGSYPCDWCVGLCFCIKELKDESDLEYKVRYDALRHWREEYIDKKLGVARSDYSYAGRMKYATEPLLFVLGDKLRDTFILSDNRCGPLMLHDIAKAAPKSHDDFAGIERNNTSRWGRTLATATVPLIRKRRGRTIRSSKRL
tara:strand:- start:23485 stop:24588 length:1104 start_codon:yes stop_codon:yes gene_type:complete